jgi:hypothetical protein
MKVLSTTIYLSLYKSKHLRVLILNAPASMKQLTKMKYKATWICLLLAEIIVRRHCSLALIASVARIYAYAFDFQCYLKRLLTSFHVRLLFEFLLAYAEFDVLRNVVLVSRRFSLYLMRPPVSLCSSRLCSQSKGERSACLTQLNHG